MTLTQLLSYLPSAATTPPLPTAERCQLQLCGLGYDELRWPAPLRSGMYSFCSVFSVSAASSSLSIATFQPLGITRSGPPPCSSLSFGALASTLELVPLLASGLGCAR